MATVYLRRAKEVRRRLSRQVVRLFISDDLTVEVTIRRKDGRMVYFTSDPHRIFYGDIDDPWSEIFRLRIRCSPKGRRYIRLPGVIAFFPRKKRD